MAKSIYMDYAAATPLDPAVLKAMQPYFSECFYNPSASYGGAREVRQALEKARARLAHWLGTRPAEIFFTAGGTEANNLAIHGIMRQYPQANIVVSAIEHESVLEPARLYKAKVAPVRSDGRLDLAALGSLIDEKTVLISIMQANNEIGTVEPLRSVGELVQAIRRERLDRGNKLPLYLHSDACQAANYLDLHVNRSIVDLLTINGGKVYGPKQSGAFYVKAGIQLQPLLLGGGQERNLRSGTEQVASIVGLAAALDKAQAMRHEEATRLGQLQQLFFQEVEKSLPQATINGSKKFRLPNNIHLTLPGSDNERLLFALDEAGVQAAAGSACNASNEEPSHVLKALGKSAKEAQASLRFTMGRGTTATDVRTTVNLLRRLSSTE